MRRPAPALLFVWFAALAPSADAAEFSPAVEEASAPAPKPAASRPASTTVTAMLADTAPKYAPPAAAPKPVEPAETHEADKPRNGIIRLPKYYVEEKRVPSLNQRDMLTKRGAIDLAYQRHPGLRFGSFGPLNNDTWAKAMTEEEMGIERAKEMYDLLGFIPGAKRYPIFTGRPPWSTPSPASGPWAGLVVPWERK